MLLLCVTGALVAAGAMLPTFAQNNDNADTPPAVRQRGNPPAPRGEGGRPQRPRNADSQATNAASDEVAPLTAEEIRVLRQMIVEYKARQEAQGPRGQGQGPRGDRPGGRPQRGEPGEAGPPQRRAVTPEDRQRMLERFDTDGDGQLSQEERRAARETMQQERQQGPRQGQ